MRATQRKAHRNAQRRTGIRRRISAVAPRQQIVAKAAVQVVGTGTTILSGDSSYSGGTTLNAGTLGLYTNTALGTGALTVGNASLKLGRAVTRLDNDITLTGDADQEARGHAREMEGKLQKKGGDLVVSGDVNGDGLADLVVGAPYSDASIRRHSTA